MKKIITIICATMLILPTQIFAIQERESFKDARQFHKHKNILTITATAEAGGKISPEGVVTVKKGTNKTFTITPDAGYVISAVTVDGVNRGAIGIYTFTKIKVAHTISATFSKINYVITVTQGENGTITPDTVSVSYGGSQTFTITPSAGYQISNLIVDGTNVAATGTYAFTNVTAAHTLSAVFATSTPSQINRFNSSLNCEIASIAVKDGLIYITERSSQGSLEYVCTRVRVLTTSGDPVRTIGNLGDGQGEFSMPKGIDADSGGKIYVADDFSHNLIQVFSNDGTSVSWNLSEKPRGVAVAASGVYVAAGDSIKKMDSGGNLLFQWGSYGFGNGLFNFTNDVAVDGLGNVYVLETESNRVQKFTADGQFIWMTGFVGPYGADVSSEPGYFSNPRGIGVDSVGNLYVADTGNHRVQKFSPSGQFLFSWGSQGNGEGQFVLPTDVAVGGDGYIYVTGGAGSDFRIQKFTP